MKKQETNGSMQVLLSEFGKKIDNFLIDLSESGEDLAKDAQSQYSELKNETLDRLNQIKAEFYDRYDKIRTWAHTMRKELEDEERWEAVDAQLKKVQIELQKVFDILFKKYGNQN